MSEDKKDPLVPVWVVGEIDIEESKLDEKGVQQAVQDELEGTGFQVTYAEPT